MPRLIQDNFSKGMVTDVTGALDSLGFLYNAYVAQPNHIAGRGPVIAAYMTNVTPSGRYANGVSTAKFHPNIGLAYVQGMLDYVSTATSATAYASQDRSVESSTSYGLVASPLRAAFEVNPEVADLEAGVMVTEGSEIVFAGYEDRLFKWGGQTAAVYLGNGTKKVATTGASTTLTGSGGADFSGVQPGQYILIDDVGERTINGIVQQRAYLIKRVISTTQIEIENPLTIGTAKNFRIQNVAMLQSPSGTWNSTDEVPRQRGVVAYHASRLFTAGVADNATDYSDVFNYDRVRFSGTINEIDSASTQMWGTDLWGANDYFDVFPGKGGAIVGLVSMGRNLIVIKTHGLFRVTADFSYNGSSVPDIQVISESIGAMSQTAWTMCDGNLVFANDRGAYIFDGEEVKSLTDGRVSLMWNAELTNFDRMFVGSYEGKVFFHCSTTNLWGTEYTDSMVWDSTGDYWWICSHGMGTCAETVYDSQDNLVGHFTFPQYGWDAGTRTQGYHNVSNITHGWGFRASGDWAEVADVAAKNIYVQSTKFPLGVDSVSEGRITEAYVHAASDEDVIVEMHVGAGSSIFWDWSYFANYHPYTGQYFYPASGIRGSESLFGDVTDTTRLVRDRVTRIDVSGEMEQAARGSVVFYLDGSDADGNAGYAECFNIYSIGIEVEPVEVRDYFSEENTGATT